MLYLALSCLQGLEQMPAVEQLLALPVDGIQLTPGNIHSPGLKSYLDEKSIPYRRHHGFDWQKYKTPVWSDSADLLVESESVHPPKLNEISCTCFLERLIYGDYLSATLELMYPGYCLGGESQILLVMELEQAIAVDISHIYIQYCQGFLSDHTWRLLQEYPNITEIHISSNKGKVDNHQPLTFDMFGLQWAVERSHADNIPLVLECYMHKLSFHQRLNQVYLAKGM